VREPNDRFWPTADTLTGVNMAGKIPAMNAAGALWHLTAVDADALILHVGHTTEDGVAQRALHTSICQLRLSWLGAERLRRPERDTANHQQREQHTTKLPSDHSQFL